MPEIKQFTISTDGERRVASFVKTDDEVSTVTINAEQEASAQAFLSDLQNELEQEPADKEPQE